MRGRKLSGGKMSYTIHSFLPCSAWHLICLYNAKTTFNTHKTSSDLLIVWKGQSRCMNNINVSPIVRHIAFIESAGGYRWRGVDGWSEMLTCVGSISSRAQPASRSRHGAHNLVASITVHQSSSSSPVLRWRHTHVTIYRQIIARNCFRQITAAARVFVGDAQQSRTRSMITLRALRHIRDGLHASAPATGMPTTRIDEQTTGRPGGVLSAEWRSIEQDYVIAGTCNK